MAGCSNVGIDLFQLKNRAKRAEIIVTRVHVCCRCTAPCQLSIHRTAL